MASNNTTPQTQNREWGFFGTISHYGDAEVAWPIAINTVSDATQLPAETVAIFLDSRHGRHFADDVANGIVTATKQNPLKVPIVIRLTGTNEELALQILKENGFSASSDMDSAVQRAVELATKGGAA